MLKTCPFSGEKFIPKRKNQVFASAENRRNFHNDNAMEIRKLLSPINRNLEKNLIICSALVQEGESKMFRKEELLLKGFNPNFFTHLDMYNDSMCMCLYHFIFPKNENPNYITIIYPKND